MFTIKIVQTFYNKSVCIQIKWIPKRLFWLSNFPGAAILNNCDVSWLPYCCKTIALCVRYHWITSIIGCRKKPSTWFCPLQVRNVRNSPSFSITQWTVMNFISQWKRSSFTAPLNNIWSAIYKCIFCYRQSNVRWLLQASDIAERAVIKSNRWAQFKQHSRKLGGAVEHLIDGSEKCICRFRVRMLLKGAVTWSDRRKQDTSTNKKKTRSGFTLTIC